MNKEELVASVANKTKMSKKQTEAGIQATIEAISDALAKGDKVTLVGFGTFQVKERAAREGRNPRTGAVLKIAAKKTPAFTPGKGLKETVAAAKGKKAPAKAKK
jgi:DNA-binding protein HU-beta